MRALQTIVAVCFIVLTAAAVSRDQGEIMSDDPTLIIAAERNDTATVRRLLNAGADIYTRDGQGHAALLAVTAHNLEVWDSLFIGALFLPHTWD